VWAVDSFSQIGVGENLGGLIVAIAHMGLSHRAPRGDRAGGARVRSGRWSRCDRRGADSMASRVRNVGMQDGSGSRDHGRADARRVFGGVTRVARHFGCENGFALETFVTRTEASSTFYRVSAFRGEMIRR
jgi:hypothetical protein